MRRRHSSAFTLIELLVAISVISILVCLVMPALGRARSLARATQCTHHLRQMGAGWQLYADGHRQYCMPQVYFRHKPPLYWWGINGEPADHGVGLLAPFLEVTAGIDNVWDCPEQPWGSYIPQGTARSPTTTYGYNAMYLAPPACGWAIGRAKTHWRTMDEIASPSQLFVFADTALDWTNRGHLSNNCLLDGPYVVWDGRWTKNRYPTLRFRHLGRAAIVFGDGHGERIHYSRGTLTSTASRVGYVGEGNAPHYVPDWKKWF